MAKQTVNLGSSANDGTGDPLRTAFDKINDNFDELYLYNSAGSGNNIEITGNTIATDNTNGDITLDPNGTGRVILATASELRFTNHVDNAIAYVDADGDMKFSANMTYDGTTATIEAITMAGGTLGTASTNQDLQIDPSGTGTLNLVIPSQATVGAAGGATNVPAAPSIYFKIKVNGTEYVVPAFAVS